MDEGVPEVDVTTTAKRVQAGALLLDVREPEELRQLRSPDATPLPLSTFMESWEATVPRDREVLVICRSGARSHRAAHFLRSQGVAASNVAGGMLDWEAAGLPTESG